MERHQHAVVKILSRLGRVGVDKLLTNQSFSQQAWWFRYRACHLWVRNDICCLLLLPKKSRVNIEQQECCVQFWNFSGFVSTFFCINWVFNAFMCIIQIWATRTCSNAYKLVENSNMCPWLHAYVPCKKKELMSNTLPSSLDRKHWDT